MILLIVGLVVFFGVHFFSAFRSREPGRDLRTKMGYGPFMGLYSLVSLLGFVLIVIGYGQAVDTVPVYAAPSWGRHLNYVLMLPALIALMAAYAPKGRIAKVLKHPMLVSVKIWAVGHLLANGDLASILLFGGFLAYAVVDRIAVKKRGDLGAGTVTSPSTTGDLMSVVGGTAAFLTILFWLHPVLFGKAVWPPVPIA